MFGLAASVAYTQEPERDFIAFTSIGAVSLTELNTNAFDDSDVTPNVDIVYSQTGERFRVYGEFLFTDDEQEVERLQFGWQLGEATRVWVGRFHAPGSFWNTEYHHGQLLQTSIARPSIDAYEDQDGVLPMHLSGALFEHRTDLEAGGALQLEVAVGHSTRLEGTELETFNVLDPDSGFEPAIDLRVDYLPNILDGTLFGVSYGQFEIPISGSVALPALWDPSATSLDLESTDLHANWETDRWRLIAAFRHVAVSASGGQDGAARSFSSRYIHVERTLTDAWKLYGRVEDTGGDQSYLELFPRYIRKQSLLGVRWSIGVRHAITAELRTSEAGSDHFHAVALQWSAAFL